MSNGIFLSYRRDDGRHVVGRLVDYLSTTFGDSKVFRDIDDIAPGVDFSDVLREALESCAVMLVVIGPAWLNTRDKDGGRRLDNPNDWCRTEIVTALERNIRVVPVLVEGTKLPHES